MAIEDDAFAGLTDWLNSLDIAEPVHAVQDLSNGEVIWSLLQTIDESIFVGTLPEDITRFDHNSKDSWIPRWNNLKHLYRYLESYLIEDIGIELPLFDRNPDLQAIAQNVGQEDLIILLRLCVIAAANCAERISFLQGMQQVYKPTQRVLMETLQAVQPVSSRDGSEHNLADDSFGTDAEDISDAARSDVPTVEETIPVVKTAVDLAFEERLAKVIADNQRVEREKQVVERQLKDVNTRYESLQDSLNKTQEELGQTNDRLTAVLSGKANGTGKSTEARQDTIIAALEARISESDVELSELRKNVEVLKLKADRAQQLQDDYDEIKIERDKLSRKANTAEKYRVKLEAVQDMEKENVSLKDKLADLQTQLRHSDTSRASSSDLQREIDEYRRLLPNIEQERYEVNEMKKRLEFDYHALTARYSESEEQLRRSRQEIEDLQGRLRDYDDGFAAPEPKMAEVEQLGEKDLETEEADFAAAEARLMEAVSSKTIEPSQTPTTVTTSPNSDLDDNGISEDELRAIMSAMRAQVQAGTLQERESGVKIQKRLVIMLEKARSKNVSLLEHIQKQGELISNYKLQAEQMQNEETVNEAAKKAREGKTDDELEQQLDDQDAMIDNLKREIRLISSAWYEQNQRMGTLGSGGGSGVVALMRLKNAKAHNAGGVEEPKSFLGKQRKLIDRTVLGSIGTS